MRAKKIVAKKGRRTTKKLDRRSPSVQPDNQRHREDFERLLDDAIVPPIIRSEVKSGKAQD